MSRETVYITVQRLFSNERVGTSNVIKLAPVNALFVRSQVLSRDEWDVFQRVLGGFARTYTEQQAVGREELSAAPAIKAIDFSRYRDVGKKCGLSSPDGVDAGIRGAWHKRIIGLKSAGASGRRGVGASGRRGGRDETNRGMTRGAGVARERVWRAAGPSHLFW